MLWCKGVPEFVAAARQLGSQQWPARFVIAGRVDKENLNHIPREQLLAWHHEGCVEWWGDCENMPEVLGRATVVCLPTCYGEGLPKVLLEAASCGKPIVATDMRGCRDICRPGVNGLLIPSRDSEALAAAIRTLLADAALRRKMGEAGRRLVLEEFTAKQVARQTVDLYCSLVKHPESPQRSLRRAA
jgi:glycosyltransferase involved in cell wall biosynthesis